jgi:UDP-N-acetylmuramyl pentapeptide synthase
MENNQAAVAYLEEHLEPQDVVLIKGSNAQKLEEIVSALALKGRMSVN